MTSRYFCQVVQGLWNPREQNYSWVIVEEYDTPKQARAALDMMIAESLGLGFGDKLTNDLRETYSGAPLAILQLTSRILERVGPDAQKADAA